jgi:hypothetical protein
MYKIVKILRLPGMKAEKFDEKFEADEDFTELMDFSKARRQIPTL